MMYYMVSICIYVCVDSSVTMYVLREVHTQGVKRETNGMDSEKVEGIEKEGREGKRGGKGQRENYV